VQRTTFAESLRLAKILCRLSTTQKLNLKITGIYTELKNLNCQRTNLKKRKNKIQSPRLYNASAKPQKTKRPVP
jgi:hypothetical protein